MKLLGIAGFKQGGKSSTANFLVGQEMVALEVISHFSMSEKGLLMVPAQVGEEVVEGEFDPSYVTKANIGWLAENIFPYIQIYGFATKLKRNIAMDLFGIKEEQLFGTDEQKNSETHIKWENIPIHASKKKGKTGFITAREFLQVMGTEICRAIDNEVWIRSMLNSIKEDNGYFDNPNRICIASDVRYNDEAKAIKDEGGKILYLTRQPFKDEHSSEKGIDQELADWVINNETMNMDEKNVEVNKVLTESGFLDYTINKGELE